MDITITATATLVELIRNALQLAGGPVSRELWAGFVATLAENRASTLAGLLAMLAWGCAVLTLFALTAREGGGGAGARVGVAGDAGERVAVALPPRRLLTVSIAPAPAPVDVTPVPAAPVLVETAPALVQAAPAVETTPAVETAAAVAVVPSAETFPSRQAAPWELPVLTTSRCRRCTQPRCWPSTGERSPARTLGVSAPRGCRAPVAATPGARCLPAPQGRPSTCGARGPFRELTPVHRGGPPRGRGPRRRVTAP